jgi:hypothetical protein
MPKKLNAQAALTGVFLVTFAAHASPPPSRSREVSDKSKPVVVPTGDKPKLDGTITDREWKSAVTRKLSNDGSVRFLMTKDRLYVGVRGKAAGWSHLIVQDGRRIRVLHASNALGEVSYELQKDEAWSLKGSLQWEVAGPIPPRQLPRKLDQYLKKNGWTATNNNAGRPTDMEFEIDLAAMGRPKSLRVVVVYSTNDVAAPPSVWPPATKDDAVNRDLMNGEPPKKASLNPGSWGLLKLARDVPESANTTKPSRPGTSRPASKGRESAGAFRTCQ